MGWLKLGTRTAGTDTGDEDVKSLSQHIETISLNSAHWTPYPHAALSVQERDLPFIAPEEVSKRKSAQSGGLFIVVDGIVYDCTHFITEHPGGEQVIESFAGAECSWQFWRFHGKSEMEEFGKPLRVGRTKGMVNKFEEPAKYVGLRRLGDDSWD